MGSGIAIKSESSRENTAAANFFLRFSVNRKKDFFYFEELIPPPSKSYAIDHGKNVLSSFFQN